MKINITKFITVSILVAITALLYRAMAFEVGTNGTQTGFVEAVQQEGVIWQNYHIFIKSSNEASQADKYCILERNRHLAEDIRRESEGGSKISIKYHRNFYLLPLGRCDGDEVESFKVIK